MKIGGRTLELNNLIKDSGGYSFILVTVLLLLGFILPVVVYFRPFGTDVYTHMVYTRKMYESTSLSEFYGKMLEETSGAELGYGYPFGLWLFGALVAKVTGVGAYDIAYFIPLVLVFVICIVYYIFAKLFLESKQGAMMSVAFLLSMPIISLFLLRYRSSVFVTLFLIVILYLAHKDNTRLRKIVPLTVLLVFALCISHTGSYLFLISFTVAYILLNSIIWGTFHRRMYSLVTVMLVVYVLTMNAFPNIREQYVNKSSFFCPTNSLLGITLLKEAQWWM